MCEQVTENEAATLIRMEQVADQIIGWSEAQADSTFGRGLLQDKIDAAILASGFTKDEINSFIENGRW